MLEIINTDYQSSNMPTIKVIGIGGCGNNAINRLALPILFNLLQLIQTRWYLINLKPISALLLEKN